MEFALIAPIFFGLVFGAIDGGLLLYVVGTAGHSVNLGALTLAAKGTDLDADTATIASMDPAGTRQVGLGTITEYDIYMLNRDGSNRRDGSSCAMVNGSQGCFDSYAGDGTLLAGNWPPSARDVSVSTGSFVELDLHYTYRFVATRVALTLTASRYLRLEPQS